MKCSLKMSLQIASSASLPRAVQWTYYLKMHFHFILSGHRQVIGIDCFLNVHCLPRYEAIFTIVSTNGEFCMSTNILWWYREPLCVVCDTADPSDIEVGPTWQNSWNVVSDLLIPAPWPISSEVCSNLFIFPLQSLNTFSDKTLLHSTLCRNPYFAKSRRHKNAGQADASNEFQGKNIFQPCHAGLAAVQRHLVRFEQLYTAASATPPPHWYN
jgi:hypothetical protein